MVIEFLYLMYVVDCVCVNIMCYVNDFCDEFGDDGLGIVFDFYYMWWDFELEV